ncbi:hypothetical protein B0I72DRAFT_136926 [Yarrowia lipolytica]|uniref:Secreted protein n=1 Tax=Yarrowia lipolytica TaxID=4952 RepID=A0A371C7Z3_YARLL|nr:hypothetical protein BKA91DRAFT_132798 [Yarrowia lipolytica]KAE8172379.1 hypothetical protein BKA90DRAFT_137427 [Yarrowia lipolytica]RDW26140.1 hypothetical protein B0I71DRAFT_131335 [Yarrowia lipolytica]RDW33064.1 hypothetical protein B0I72DRAFT_136926 [Yarrowia lipolytica]RDW36173.1 hypothetical protein B0I73DRAFT_137545 [Yarrowia lipolytica]
MECSRHQGRLRLCLVLVELLHRLNLVSDSIFACLSVCVSGHMFNPSGKSSGTVPSSLYAWPGLRVGEDLPVTGQDQTYTFIRTSLLVTSA